MNKALKYFLRAALILLILGCVFVFGLFFMVKTGLLGSMPNQIELGNIVNEEASLIYSSEGAVIGKIFSQDRINVSFEEIPTHVINALVATEDKRFFEHEGVDLFSYLRVLFRTIISLDEGGGGGSTISQQVIKNIYGREDHGILSIPITKIREALIASDLEEVYMKDQILALYLNTVPFGRNTYGIEAASQRFFSKHAYQLAIEEGATLVGMLKANSYYDPSIHPDRSKVRRDLVLTLMDAQQVLAPLELDSLKKIPIDLEMAERPGRSMGYFNAIVQQRAQSILKERSGKTGKEYDIYRDGLRIYTTLDTTLQMMSVRAAKNHIYSLQKKLDEQLLKSGARNKWEKTIDRSGFDVQKDTIAPRIVFDWNRQNVQNMTITDSLWHYRSMLNCSVLMTEVGSGKVRVWVGGNDHQYLPYDLVRSKRQAASAFKPILYTAALEHGAEPCDYYKNEQKIYEEYNDWEPRNFDGSEGPRVAMWYALARSMNLPTVALYFETGPAALAETCEKLGLDEPDKNSPAVALGSMELSLAELVRTYSTFANKGILTDQIVIERIEDKDGKVIFTQTQGKSVQAISQRTANEMSLMLKAAVDLGTCTAFRKRYGINQPLAAKTGTSQNYSDAWTLAFTDKMAIGAWVGAMDHSVHFTNANGTGARAALPVLGKCLADMQNNKALRVAYLSTDHRELNNDDPLDCPPEKKSMNDLLDGVFGKKEHSKKEGQEKEEGKFKKWLDGVFRKKQ